MTGKHSKGQHFETQAIHAGQAPDPSTGAIMTPVFMTSTYVQDGVGRHKGYEYSRTANPTRTALEGCIAALEGAPYGLAFASALGAESTILHLFDQGDNVICSDDVYGGTFRLMDKVFSRSGLTFTVADLADPRRLGPLIRPNTRMVWVETPSNPLLKILDIKAIAEVCHSHGVLLAVDNTFATPYLQRPLDLGADLVVHSTTKYLGGHSDVVGGAVVTREQDLHAQLAFLQNAIGAVPGPMDSFLVLRGLKTLAVRMQRHVENASRIARWLEAHDQVERVLYPGLPSHPQHALASRQMSGPGGMISFVLRGDLAAARKVVESTRIFALAESLGGVESLIELPAAMTHASVPPEKRAALGIADGMIRLSVGIEHVDDLIADLHQAFAAAR